MLRNIQPTQEGELFKDPKGYKRVVWKLNYLIGTHPDIASLASIVSRFTTSPTVHYWAALEQILCYLKGAPGRCLIYGNHRHNRIECFLDADWGRLQNRQKIHHWILYVCQRKCCFLEKQETKHSVLIKCRGRIQCYSTISM